MTAGSTSPIPGARAPWALVRTGLVLLGLGFVIASLVGACLDHYDESFGCEPTPTAGALQAGSGEGSGSVPAAGAADCGAPVTSSQDGGTEVGSGSGSAAAP